MPNGKHTWSPQIVGMKETYKMSKIDREGLGPWIIKYKHDNPTKGYRKIADAILAEFGVAIGWRDIGFYLSTFIDPETGLLVDMDKLPNIPDRHNIFAVATDIHEVLKECQLTDVTILEELANAEFGWFKDPEVPIPLKLKVAKELRETIKLKLEMGGIVKPTNTTNVTNNITMGDNLKQLQGGLEANPDAVAVLRELLYLAVKSEPVDVTPVEGVQGD